MAGYDNIIAQENVIGATVPDRNETYILGAHERHDITLDAVIAASDGNGYPAINDVVHNRVRIRIGSEIAAADRDRSVDHHVPNIIVVALIQENSVAAACVPVHREVSDRVPIPNESPYAVIRAARVARNAVAVAIKNAVAATHLKTVRVRYYVLHQEVR